MKENIYSISENYIKAKVEGGVCPLNWLAEFYRAHNGKLVMLDNNLMIFLLNHSHCDSIEEQKFDGYKQTFTLVWNATEKFPETKVVISSYGRDAIEKEDEYIVNSVENYYIIEELYADDILINGQRYAENAIDDAQMVFLVADKLEQENELTI